MEGIKDKILEEYKKGNIVVATPDGIMGMNLEEFIKQPAEGMLYDLNRSEPVVLTFINDPKWVNDYAVCQTIRILKDNLDKLEEENKRLKESIKDTSVRFHLYIMTEGKAKLGVDLNELFEEWSNQHNI